MVIDIKEGSVWECVQPYVFYKLLRSGIECRWSIEPTETVSVLHWEVGSVYVIVCVNGKQTFSIKTKNFLLFFKPKEEQDE